MALYNLNPPPSDEKPISRFYAADSATKANTMRYALAGEREHQRQIQDKSAARQRERAAAFSEAISHRALEMQPLLAEFIEVAESVGLRPNGYFSEHNGEVVGRSPLFSRLDEFNFSDREIRGMVTPRKRRAQLRPVWLIDTGLHVDTVREHVGQFGPTGMFGWTRGEPSLGEPIETFRNLDLIIHDDATVECPAALLYLDTSVLFDRLMRRFTDIAGRLYYSGQEEGSTDCRWVHHRIPPSDPSQHRNDRH
jgi:hypothetical protein